MKNHIPGSSIVIGTTPIDTRIITLLKDSSGTSSILLSNNFNLSLIRFVYLLINKYRSLPFSLKELHGIHKKDSPSGTSWYLANFFKINRIDSVRIGYQSGTHIMMIEENNIPIHIKHISYTPIDFLHGLSMAIRFLQKKSIGLYTLGDI